MQIVIKKSYFDNIKVAIDAMNNFFASSFKTKAFPVINDDFQLDRIVSRTISWLNNIEPEWVDHPEKAVQCLNALKDAVEKSQPVQESAEEGYDIKTMDQSSPWFNILNGSNQTAQDYLHAFIGFKMLQYITENFDRFEELLNGIYSFELFTSPAAYRAAIETFTKPIPLPEIDSIAKFPGEYKLFDSADYIQSIFDNDQIKLPEDMMPDTETQRFESFTNLQDCEIVIDDTVQEAAAVNYFKESKPEHIMYDPKKNRWKISKQLESSVNKLIKALRVCDNTDDVLEYFSNLSANEPILFAQNVIPYIYANLLTIKKKEWDNPATADENFKKYSKSYESIIRKNPGAKRFARYDIFTTFKNDKEGTIKFLEDFLKLNLVNDENCAISNSIILALFNIFDSRIYLDILYNLIPDDMKKDKYPTEDGFVKLIRARINKNSRVANPYQKKKVEVDNTAETSADVEASVNETMKEYANLTLSEMRHCGAFMEAVYREIETLGDAIYNNGMSQIKLDHYIGESYTVVQEQETGDIPDYMKERILLQQKQKKDEQEKQQQVTSTQSDDANDEFTIPDLNLDIPVPMNDPDELTASIQARLNTPGADSLGDMLGSGYQGQISDHGGRGTVVYNITYNTNSHNTTHTVSNDLSTGKTTTSVDMSENKRTNAVGRNKPTNNYDNTSPSSNSKESTNTFSNGKSVHEVFALLGSKEPLFVESDAGKPPKGDVLTTAMDVDRKTLPVQQKVKRGVQKVGNTVRATVKPFKRTKMWLRKMVDSVIKRDEDRVKADIVENPSYRSAVYKAARIALKFGLFSVFSAISPVLGVGYLGVQGLKLADKERLRREASEEIATEIRIIDQKIENLKNRSYYGGSQSPENEEEYARLMRIRSKLVQMSTNAYKRSTAGTSRSAY